MTAPAFAFAPANSFCLLSSSRAALNVSGVAIASSKSNGAPAIRIKKSGAIRYDGTRSAKPNVRELTSETASEGRTLTSNAEDFDCAQRPDAPCHLERESRHLLRLTFRDSSIHSTSFRTSFRSE